MAKLLTLQFSHVFLLKLVFVQKSHSPCRKKKIFEKKTAKNNKKGGQVIDLWWPSYLRTNRIMNKQACLNVIRTLRELREWRAFFLILEASQDFCLTSSVFWTRLFCYSLTDELLWLQLFLLSLPTLEKLVGEFLLLFWGTLRARILKKKAIEFGDKFGESLGGSQATPSFWEVPGLPRKFPKLPWKFFGDFPGSFLTVELYSNPGVPGKFPRLPRKFQ